VMVGCLLGLGCDIWMYTMLGLQYNGGYIMVGHRVYDRVVGVRWLDV
jgi:hypothetical protein